MRYYEATATIAAPADAVWAVLTDAPGWARWDSGVDGVDGRLAPGEKVTIRSSAAPGRSFPVRVDAFDPPRMLRLRGGMPLGLFTGVRTFTLSSRGGGGTEFHLREEYTGPLLGLIWRSMPDLGPSFAQFAGGLKKRVEAGD